MKVHVTLELSRFDLGLTPLTSDHLQRKVDRDFLSFFNFLDLSDLRYYLRHLYFGFDLFGFEFDLAPKP